MSVSGMISGMAVGLALATACVAQPNGANGNIREPAEALQRRLQNDSFVIRDVEETSGGVMETAKWTLEFADGFTTEAKWKAAPGSGDGWNNSPRRELAAYELQRLFLDPDDFVVPPAAARCVPLDVYRAADDDAQPNLPRGQCVFGLLSAWLQNVRRPDEVPDMARFTADPRYAYEFGNLNIFTFLAAHRDARAANFLISTDATNPQIFSIDNGIAFGGVLYNFFTWHFDEIVVGGLPQRTIERVRRLTPADFARLGVVAELRAGPDGVLRPVTPSPNADPDAGVRLLPDGVQLGLTAEELGAVILRHRELVQRLERGEIPTFSLPRS